MKKIIYATLISLAICLTFSACTEEQISPKVDASGGNVSEPIKN